MARCRAVGASAIVRAALHSARRAAIHTSQPHKKCNAFLVVCKVPRQKVHAGHRSSATSPAMASTWRNDMAAMAASTCRSRSFAEARAKSPTSKGATHASSRRRAWRFDRAAAGVCAVDQRVFPPALAHIVAPAPITSVAIVTGGGGIGREIAVALGVAGLDVVVAVRPSSVAKYTAQTASLWAAAARRARGTSSRSTSRTRAASRPSSSACRPPAARGEDPVNNAAAPAQRDDAGCGTPPSTACWSSSRWMCGRTGT